MVGREEDFRVATMWTLLDNANLDRLIGINLASSTTRSKQQLLGIIIIFVFFFFLLLYFAAAIGC